MILIGKYQSNATVCHSPWRIGKSLFAIGIWSCVDLTHMPQSLTPTHLNHSHTFYMGRYMFLRHLDVKKRKILSCKVS